MRTTFGTAPDRRPTRRIRGGVVAIGAILVASLLVPEWSFAADPPSAQGQRHLAETLGGVPNDFELLYERTAGVEHSDETLWAAKYVDHRSGEVHAVYRDRADGTIAGTQLHAQHVASVEEALAPIEAKADAELMAAVAGKRRAGKPNASVSVGVWLEVDVAKAERAVMDRHPELTWDGDRPVVGDLETARAIRAELAAARAGARQSALDQLRVDTEALGGSLGYASTSAPLAYLDLPADR